jgi:mRNA interferase MazF
VGLKRGDLVIVSAPGSYCKPRPSVVIQSDTFDKNGSLTVLLMSSHLKSDSPLIRHTIQPSESNGLNLPTDVMIDKIFTIPRDRMGDKIGHLSSTQMAEITSSLAIFLGIRVKQS